MSARRGGKKKTQQKQQTLLTADDDAAPQQPATLTTPASPAVIMQQLASKAITPVVTAAKAITTAVLTMPAIAEGATIGTAQVDNDQPQSPGPSTGIQQPAFAMTAQKLFADSHPQKDQIHSQEAAAVQESPSQESEPPASSEQQEDPLQQEAADGPSLWLRTQQFCSSCSWRGGLLLCAAILIPVLIAIVVQGQVLKSQAHALRTQQELVAAQAQALQELRQELQATSAQLPSLKNTAHATESSLSTLTAEQTALLASLEGLTASTQHLAAQLGHMNHSQQAGQQAWELLQAVAALNCSNASNSSAACAEQGAASIHNASAALKSLLLQSLQQQQQQEKKEKEAQHKAQQQVPTQAPLPLLDVALADCGARIVFSTPVNASAMPHLARSTPVQHSSNAALAISMLQQLQAALKPKPADPPTGAGPAADTAENAAAEHKAAVADLQQHQLLLHRVLLRPASGLLPVSCIPMMDPLHGAPVLVEIQLPQPAYVHSVAVQASRSLDGISAHGTVDAPAAFSGQVSVALLNSSSCSGPAVSCTRMHSAAADSAVDKGNGAATLESADGAAWPVSSSARPAASAHGRGSQVTASVLKPGVAAAVYDGTAGPGSGRVVIPVAVKGAAAGSSVLADRVVVVMQGSVGISGLCMGRISVHGRPSDPEAFC